MLNFPTPYPNELIYSTIARAGIHHAITSPKQLLEDDVQIIDVVPTHFDFLEAIETRKTSKKTRHRNHGTKDQDLPSTNATSEVSTNEPISEGTISPLLNSMVLKIKLKFFMCILTVSLHFNK
ncbi:hypothetical protein [Snodgrassella sp. CFCC 13594]|uniref:hypothetical protein n=1 Tax=Snodgrassella sp. CFCC 13594 TaxID=1775559 RepID=UPI000A9CDD63|nr:hypothetical protein [Snodgrassella sp. CFCC 13594]